MPTRFKDDTDFRDFDFHPGEGGRARGARDSAPLRLPSAPRARPVLPPQRASTETPGSNKALALAVADLHSYLSRGDTDIRAKGRMMLGPSARSDNRRTPARSEALAKQRAQAASPAPVQRAKAIAADRRMFNPTSGPKTLFGTSAQVKPTSAARFRFAFPAVSAPCVARKTRKEVLFALGRARGSRKRKKFGPYSNIGC